MLELICACLEHHDEYLVLFIAGNLVAIDAVVSIMQVLTRHRAQSEYKHSLMFRVRCYVDIATKPMYRLQIRPNSAQLEGIPYHSAKLHPGPCSSAGMWPRTGTDTHTDRQTRVITIHFASSTTHEKCKQ